jgi:hypothetical protein
MKQKKEYRTGDSVPRGACYGTAIAAAASAAGRDQAQSPASETAAAARKDEPNLQAVATLGIAKLGVDQSRCGVDELALQAIRP